MNSLEITEIKRQVKEVLEFSQDVSDLNVDRLISEWYEAKRKFIDTFESPIYSTKTKVTIDLDPSQKIEKLEDFCEMIQNTFPEYKDLVVFIRENTDSFFSNILEKAFIYKDYCIKPGIKFFKAFREFVPNENDLYFIQTAASRIIQENKITGYLCLSVHPLDYLSSSENNYNWRSCHALNGEYRAGNLSYMLDSSTIVCYICGDDNEILPRFPETVPWNSKKWRMLLFVSDNWNALFAGRQYPFFSKAIMEEVRCRWINKVDPIRNGYYSYYYNKPSWSHWHDDCVKEAYYKEWDEDDGALFDRYVYMRDKILPMSSLITDESDLHFNDLIRSSYYIPYYCWRWGLDNNIHFTIGAKVHCLKCGQFHLDDPGAMLCENCLEEDGFIRCADCEELISEDDAIWIDSESKYICRNCYEDNYLECENCYEIYHRDDMQYYAEDDAWYCPYCYAEAVGDE